MPVFEFSPRAWAWSLDSAPRAASRRPENIPQMTYKRFYPGAQGKAGRKGTKSLENSGQAANCQAEIGI
jgi:hypothetical protein